VEDVPAAPVAAAAAPTATADVAADASSVSGVHWRVTGDYSLEQVCTLPDVVAAAGFCCIAKQIKYFVVPLF
jgi:hypothetical protein